MKTESVDDEKENFYKIDCSLLIISFAVVFCKIVIGLWSSLSWPNLFENAYLLLPISAILSLWLSAEWFIKPLIVGIMMSFITWQIIYLDSDIPGLRPTTPFSYGKYYTGSKQMTRFHLCYIFALAVAPLTTISLIFVGCYS